MTYYDILGVPYNASAEQIKKAYREQIRFFHPDVFQGSEDVAKIKTQQLNEAYAVLGDPKKRAVYDFDLKRSKERQEEQPKEEAQEEPKEETKEKHEPEDAGNDPPGPEPEKKKKEKKKPDPEKQEKRKAFASKAFKVIKVVAIICALLWLWNGCERMAQREREKEDQKIWDEAYQSGYYDGQEDGYEDGYFEGESEGYSIGSEDGYAYGYEEGYLDGGMEARFGEFEITVYCDDKLKTYHKYNDCPKIDTLGQELTQGDALTANYQKCYPCFEPNGYIAGLTDGFNTGFAEASK